MPNLLFITTDQQRFDTLPCYGLDFIETPALDRLARERVVFENAIVPAPLCVPCRAALLTGQYPSTTGIGGGANLSIAPTWPGLVGVNGRRTAAIGKMHFNPWDDPGGFQERIIAEDKRHVYLPDDHVQFLRANGMERFHPTEKPRYFENLGASVTPREKRFHIDAFVGDRAAGWLEKNGRDSFAAWVSFPGPHDPYDPPEEMAERYYDAPIPEPIRPPTPDELAKRPPTQGQGFNRTHSAMYRYDLTRATPDQIRLWRAHYYANITLIDEGIGKILSALESVGTLDDTLIVFTSDHGDALGDHGLCLKSFFYDCMVHVPLILRGPDVPEGRRSASLVSLLDLIPLFYRTCGVEPPDTLQGTDISTLLHDPDATLREIVFSENRGRAMALTDRHKYAHYADGSAELYDLEADPQELTNLAGSPDHADTECRLRGHLLEHWLGNHPYQARALSAPPNPIRAAVEAEFRAQRGSNPE